MTKDIGWRTINGTHVYLSGKGTIMKGPTALVGHKASDIKGSSGKLIYAQDTISLMSAKADYKKLKSEAKKVEKANKKKVSKPKEEVVTPNERKAKPSQPKKMETTNSDTVFLNGYEVPKDFVTSSGSLKKAKQEEFNKHIRKDPTRAISHQAVSKAFADEFKKAGITNKEIIRDASDLMRKGDSFEVALKKAIEIDEKFN